MSITSNEYIRSNIVDILLLIESNLKALKNRVNTRYGSTYYEIMKIFAFLEDRFQQLVGELIQQITPMTARSFILDKMGIDRGVFRRGEQLSEGSVRITTNPVDRILAIGSIFSTPEGRNYLTIEQARLPTYIAVVRGDGSDDSIPTPYSNLTSVAWVNSAFNQLGTAYSSGVDYTYSSDTITWLPGKGPAEDTTYYVGVSGTVDVTVSVIGELPGTDWNIPENSVSINNSGDTAIQAVTNDVEIKGGALSESDASYKQRIVETPYRSFSFPKIRSIALNVDGVRSVRIYQNYGIDQAYPTDWTSPSPDAYVESNNHIAQLWRPGTGILNHSRVFFWGKKLVDNPNPLTVKTYIWRGDLVTTTGAVAIKETSFTKEDLDPDHPSDYQLIEARMKFAPLDWTRQYLTTVQQSGGVAHWELGYDSPGSYSNGQLYIGGTGGTEDLFFKTGWDGASYTIQLSVEDGYEFDDVSNSIEDKLDFVEGDGYSTICIQRNIYEATEVHVNVRATVYLDDGYELTTVGQNAEERIRNYLRNLDPGDNVVYSKVYYNIMREPGVLKISNLEIKRNADGWETEDLLITENEVAILSTQAIYGPGTSFTRGN